MNNVLAADMIARIRLAAWTTTQIAARLGVHRTTVSRWARKATQPNANNMDALQFLYRRVLSEAAEAICAQAPEGYEITRDWVQIGVRTVCYLYVKGIPVTMVDETTNIEQASAHALAYAQVHKDAEESAHVRSGTVGRGSGASCGALRVRRSGGKGRVSSPTP
jgi:transcriptional regulator with XRE-family HTH domain